jgi:hypothetical protein
MPIETLVEVDTARTSQPRSAPQECEPECNARATNSPAGDNAALTVRSRLRGSRFGACTLPSHAPPAAG